MNLTIAKRRIRFKNLPIGLFYHEGMLCLKVESESISPTNGERYSDAYVCESGLYWWGDVGYYTQRDNVLVYPVTIEATKL